MTYKNSTGEFKTFELIRDEDITTATYEIMGYSCAVYSGNEFKPLPEDGFSGWKD